MHLLYMQIYMQYYAKINIMHLTKKYKEFCNNVSVSYS